MEATSPAPLLTPLTAAELSSKCVTDEVGALNCLCVTLGHKLRLFSQLKRLGPTSAAGLASAAAVSERWVQEWLYQQAASGYVCCDESARIFWLSEAQESVLIPPERLDDAAESPLGEPTVVPVSGGQPRGIPGDPVVLGLCGPFCALESTSRRRRPQRQGLSELLG